ncbi:MAG: glycosyltransferase family 4 protein, partial [Bacteroidota bacterium]
MKILFVKQLFHPEPTARSLDFAMELKRQGHEVQVLTSFPSYPYGKIYSGYQQKIFHRETMKGIDLIRVPIYPNQSKNGFGRMLNYLSYAFSATFFGLPRVNKPDVIFAYHGALPVGIPAMIYKLFRGTPIVYDINDLWPETLAATGMLKNKFLLRLVEKWCALTYRYVDKITVLSKGFKTALINKGVPKDKILTNDCAGPIVP